MKKNWLPILLLFTFSSCVSSLYPISDGKSDYIFFEDLLGEWSNNKGDFSCRVEKSENQKYLVSLFDEMDDPGSTKSKIKIDTSYFEAFVIQLSGQYYLDCSPSEKHLVIERGGENTKSALLLLHSVFKLDIQGKDRLVLSGTSIDSTKKLITTNPLVIKNEQLSNDHILLTDKPQKIREKLLINKKTDFIFSEMSILNRRK